MQKIKITQPVMFGGKFRKAGETIEVDNGLAKNLILRKRAVSAESAAPAAPAKDEGGKGKK